ncbi:unnamed protein product [Adineta ricciae]|uniref:G-protein coupled receptors family 1 profile domain-containing protein n=1 Tax=Adineta ricciae TaxID=249248 RepID=A0A816FQI5_ADIRI|nr:unnamed protein product [Adineta ricciae]
MGNFPSQQSNVPNFWPKIEFSLFLIGIIFSIPCYLFVFYHLLNEKTARQSLHNHVILILLFYNLLIVTFDLPMTLNFNRLGYVSPFNQTACLLWQFVDNGIWYGALSLMFWASFERHILVFHTNLVSTTRRRLFFHYILLIFFSLYTPMIYVYLVFIQSCGQIYTESTILCGGICLYIDAPVWLQLYDSYIDYILPILLIPVCSITLVCRFLRQKQRLQQNVTWRQCRKMIIQITLISTVYMIFDIPAVIVFIVQVSGYSTFGSNIWFPYLARMTLVPSIIIPFATLLALPKLKDKLRNLCSWKHNQRAVFPGSTTN